MNSPANIGQSCHLLFAPCCGASAAASPGENRLLSFLLFEQAYTRELIDLGYRDAMKVKDELLDFVNGAEVPRLFAPSWIKKDLSAFNSGTVT